MASRIAGSLVVGGSAFTISGGDDDAALQSNICAGCLDGGENAVAARAVDIANVGFKPHARGDAVDGAGKNIADADRGNRGDVACGLGSRF